MSLIDSVGRVAGVRTVVSGGVGTGDVVADFRYGYDRLNNRIYEQRLHEPIEGPVSGYRTRAFTYDHGSRLTKWYEGNLGESPIGPDVTDPASQISAPSDKELWTLDSAANWTSHKAGTDQTLPDTLGRNTLNQYTQIAYEGDIGQVKAFEYDWRGQMRENEARGHRYVWDAFGRLTKVLNEAGTAIVTYRYDAFNRRVEKTVDSAYAVYDESVTRYIYDGWRVIEERDLLGETTHYESVRARYGYGIGLDEVVWMDRAVTFGAAIDNRYFLHQDAHGSVVAVSDDRTDVGQPLEVQERFTYSAYGAMTAWAGSWQSSGAAYPNSQSFSDVGVALSYTGQRYDAETGLYSFKNRIYDPELGRFVSRDPLGYLGGPSLYQYAAGDPVSMTDPLGLVPKGEGVLRYELKQCGRGDFACMSGIGGALIHFSLGADTIARLGQRLDLYKLGPLAGILLAAYDPDGTSPSADEEGTSEGPTPGVIVFELGGLRILLDTRGRFSAVDPETGERTPVEPTGDMLDFVAMALMKTARNLFGTLPNGRGIDSAGFKQINLKIDPNSESADTDPRGDTIDITLGIKPKEGHTRIFGPMTGSDYWLYLSLMVYHEVRHAYYHSLGYPSNRVDGFDAHGLAMIDELLIAESFGLVDVKYWWLRVKHARMYGDNYWSLMPGPQITLEFDLLYEQLRRDGWPP